MAINLVKWISILSITITMTFADQERNPMRREYHLEFENFEDDDSLGLGTPDSPLIMLPVDDGEDFLSGDDGYGLSAPSRTFPTGSFSAFPQGVLSLDDSYPDNDNNMITVGVVDNGLGTRKRSLEHIDLDKFMQLFPLHPSFFPATKAATSDGPGQYETPESEGADVMLSTILGMMPHIIHPQHFVAEVQKGLRLQNGYVYQEGTPQDDEDGPLLAVEESTRGTEDPCARDVEHFCKGEDNKLHCLGRHVDAIDMRCRSEIANSVPFVCCEWITKFACDGQNESQSVVSCLKLHQAQLGKSCKDALIETVGVIQKFQGSKSAKLVSPQREVVASWTHRFTMLNPSSQLPWEISIIMGILAIFVLALFWWLSQRSRIKKIDIGMELTNRNMYGAFAL